MSIFSPNKGRNITIITKKDEKILMSLLVVFWQISFDWCYFKILPKIEFLTKK